eukprot:7160696-Pyramimonas_sp.AAC.1
MGLARRLYALGQRVDGYTSCLPADQSAAEWRAQLLDLTSIDPARCQELIDRSSCTLTKARQAAGSSAAKA